MQNLRISLFALMLSAAGLPLYIHLPQFASRELGLSLATLAAILAGIRVMDFAQDPLLGWLIDRFPRARGLFAALAAIGMAAGFVCLYTLMPALAGQSSALGVALVAVLVLLFTAYSLGSILFYGQSSAIAGSEAGLMRLAAFRESGTLAGVILAALAPTVLVAMGAAGGGYAAFGIVLALICVLVFALTQPLWQQSGPVEQPLSLAELRSSGAGRLLFLALVNSLPVAMTSTLFLFFVEDKLALPELAGPFLLLFFLAAGASVPIWAQASKHYGARMVLVLAMGLATASFISATILPAGAALAFAAICVGSGAALGADMVILPVMFSATLARAGLRGGQAFGLWTLAAKLSLAAAALILLPLLELYGFTPGGPNDATALTTLTLCYALIPCLIKLLAIAMVLRLPQEVVLQ